MTKQKILVIDDEEAIRQFLKVLLEEEGYEVFTTSDGAVGLELIRKSDPVLVILDMNMPKMHGSEFYAKLADQSKGIPRIPILVLSGQGEMKRVFEYLYVYAFITKPIVPSDFIEIVHRILDPVKCAPSAQDAAVA